MTRVGRFFTITICVLLVGLVRSGMAQTEQSVVVRAWDHDSYVRLVFDLPELTQHTLSNNGGQLRVTFERALDPAFDESLAALTSIIQAGGVSDGGRTFNFRLLEPFVPRSFNSGSMVVIDLVRDSEQTATPAPPPTDPSATAPNVNTARASVDSDGQTAPFVTVRFGEHDDYDRVVFDWPAPVEYRVRADGDQQIIEFARAATIDAARLRSRLPPSIADMAVDSDSGQSTVRLSLARPSSIDHFGYEDKVVLDIRPDLNVQAAPADATGDGLSAAEIIDALVESEGDAVPTDATGTDADGALATDDGAENQNSTDPDAPPLDGDAPDANDRDSQIAGSEFPNAEPLTETAEPLTNEEVGESDATAEVEDASTKAEGTPSVAAAAVRVEHIAAPGGSDIQFAWQVPVAAAAFQRADNLWVMFDAPAAFEFVGFDAAADVSLPQQVVVDGRAVARFAAKGGHPTMMVDGNAWRLSYRKDMVSSDAVPPAIPVNLTTDPGGAARLVLDNANPGGELYFKDPEVGDDLVIVPVHEPGRGIAQAHRYVDLELLPTAQGVAVRPISDSVAVRALRSRIEINSLAGLNVTIPEATDVETSEPTADVETTDQSVETEATPVDETIEQIFVATDDPLFDFPSWSHAENQDYASSRRALNVDLSMAPEEERGPHRLNLAKFHFANLQAAEALGWLAQATRLDDELNADQTVKAMRGVANLMLDRTAEAEPDVFDSMFDDNAEMALWRGVYHAKSENFDDADYEFLRSGMVLDRYPRGLKSEIRLQTVAGALASEDPLRARFQMDAIMADRPPARIADYVDYLRGLERQLEGDAAAAVALLAKAGQSEDREVRVRAERARVELMLAEGMMNNAEAIEALEGLRFVWRGDALELGVMRRLGELYLAEGDYMRGLGAYRKAVSAFPDRPEAREIAQQMNETFEDIFLSGKADALPPVATLAIYYGFRELTPVGNRGDQMIFRLTDRLVAVDLLEDAAELLRHQVEYRLRGGELARVGARLAEIYLLDEKPEEALDALRASDIVDMPESLATQRRYLSSRAYLETKQYDEALRLLLRDESREAQLARADIYWAMQDWIAEATVLEDVFSRRNSTEPLSEEETAYMMKLAVALALANNRTALSDVRDRFGPLMARTASADAFRAIASYVDGGRINPMEITDTVAEIGAYEAFMASLRQSVADNNLSYIN